MFFVVCQSSLPSQKFATFDNERIIFAVVFEEFLVSMMDSNYMTKKLKIVFYQRMIITPMPRFHDSRTGGWEYALLKNHMSRSRLSFNKFTLCASTRDGEIGMAARLNCAVTSKIRTQQMPCSIHHQVVMIFSIVSFYPSLRVCQ